MKWIIGELKAGDHIRVNRGFYFHHGVYIGEGQVVHYSALEDDGISDASSVEVRQSNLDFFSKKSIVEKCELEGKERKYRLNPKKIVKKALSRIGEKNYHVLHHNCEDFANECCYKKPMTSQVNDIKDKM